MSDKTSITEAEKEFKQFLKKKNFKVPNEEPSNSMTTTPLFKSFPFSILWRPNNYRRQTRVKTKTNSVESALLFKWGYKQNKHTKIFSIKQYMPNITIQYTKNHLIAIYSQSKIGGNKETFLIKADSIELLDKRLNQKKQEIKNKLDKALDVY